MNKMVMDISAARAVRERRAKAPRAEWTWSRDREYKSWKAMLDRCNNPNCNQYRHYGGRGITVCARWSDFETFLADMGKCPTDDLTLERIDNEKGYDPLNCRWATRHEQNRNRRNNVFVKIGGERMIATDAAKRLDVSLGYLLNLIRSGKVDANDLPHTLRKSPSRNRSARVVFDGHEVAIQDLCETYGIRRTTFYMRLSLGWSVERAIRESVEKSCRSPANKGRKKFAPEWRLPLA